MPARSRFPSFVGAVAVLALAAIAGYFAFILQDGAGARSQQEQAAHVPDRTLPGGAIFRLGTVEFRHGSPITAIVVSPKGDVIALSLIHI